MRTRMVHRFSFSRYGYHAVSELLVSDTSVMKYPPPPVGKKVIFDSFTCQISRSTFSFGRNLLFDEKMIYIARKTLWLLLSPGIKLTNSVRKKSAAGCATAPMAFPAPATDYSRGVLTTVPSLQVGVHIADVTHFVRPNNAMDEEAASRGTSVYLVDQVTYQRFV